MYVIYIIYVYMYAYIYIYVCVSLSTFSRPHADENNADNHEDKC